MITRILTQKIKEMSKKFPVLAILGPRQSGKTTLSQAVFTKHTYISFEDLEARAFAQEDPKGFLEEYKNKYGIILDEIQHVPDMLSYIQVYVDREKQPGYFILTGSQNFLINQAITQTLAGRIAIFTLLPFCINELKKAKLLPEKINNLIFKGCYPRIYDQNIAPTDWYPNYIRTYIERDVRQIKNVTNLTTFQRFIKLCAGRIGQLLNVSSLGSDCGISTGTAREWLSLLETSYILFLLQPHHKNFSKQQMKAPKLYFYDTGLACSLLGIETEQQVFSHYLRGGLFESFILSELLKNQYNKGKRPGLFFWRDKYGHEVDGILEKTTELIPIEIKAGQTISPNFFDGIAYWSELAKQDPAKGCIIYAGDKNQKRKNGRVIGWQSTDKIFD